MSGRPSSQRGIALLLVLWMLVLLILIATALSIDQHTETRLAANRLESARFRARAEAALQYAGFQLLKREARVRDSEAEEGWSPDAQPQTWAFDGTELQIRIFNVTSLIDLNRADRSLLEALLFAAGLQEDADALLDAILDWRDANDLRLLNGAEDPDYEAAGLPYGAKDGPFDSREELLQVLGFTQAIYARIAPALTVASGRATVVSAFAPPLVRAALEGTTLEEIENRPNTETAETEGSSRTKSGPLYRVQVTSRTDGDVERVMEALIQVQEKERPPVSVLWRRYGLRTRVLPDAEPES